MLLDVSNTHLIDRLHADGGLALDEYEELLSTYTPADRDHATSLAYRVARDRFGPRLLMWGVVEIANACARDCYFCGLRASNTSLERYRLTREEILAACADGHRRGCRTLLLQGGEEAASEDDGLDDLIWAIRKKFPDASIALALGEHSHTTYRRLYAAGADRYLLGHVTADAEHYAQLHPRRRTWAGRLRSLADLRDIGYQVGAGMLVGMPLQTPHHLAEDLAFLQSFRPEIALVGTFRPTPDAPLGDQPAGSFERTLFLLSLVRILLPDVLLPCLTSVACAHARGRELAVMAGANVVAPNLTPARYQALYAPYAGKATTGVETLDGLDRLAERMSAIGYRLVGEGDVAAN